VAALLNPEGVFASFGGQMFLADKAVGCRIETLSWSRVAA
jgi:hypothetical protein